MNKCFKVASPVVFGSVLLTLLAGCSGMADTGDSSSRPNHAIVSVSEILSLTPYLPAESEGMSLADQFDMEWAFGVKVKGDDGEQPEVINSCTDAIRAYERGQEPVRSSEYQAYRQAVSACYAVRLVSSADSGRAQPLKSYTISKEWVSDLPVELAPITSTTERERILQDAEHKTWADASQIVSLDEQAPGHAIVRTPSSSQDINVLATGDLNKDGAEDVLVSVVTSTSGGSYAVPQLFLLTRRGDGDSLELVREY